MSISLENKSIPELQSLKLDIDRVIAHKMETQKAEVLTKLKTLAMEAGYSLDDLLNESGGGRRRKPVVEVSKQADGRAKVAPKYRNPANATETWTGRGKQPRWFVGALAQGLREADLLIHH